MKYALKKLAVLFLLLVAANAVAQVEDDLKRATDFLQSGNLDSAKIVINEMIGESENANNGNIWYFRGFIYKSIYNKYERDDKNSPSRLEALKSFRQSFSIDTSAVTIQESKKNIKYLATTLYNDAAISLDSMDYKLAIEIFGKFKQYYQLIDTSKQNLTQTNLKFLLALASVYTIIFDQDKIGKAEFLTLAKNTYIQILEIDPNNITANYNMGILYYNQAVNLINQLDYAIDIVTLNDAQDNSIGLFRESLPFMERAYQLDPSRRETLYGLSGIYFSLNEIDKSNLFKQKLEQIKQKQ